MFSQSITPQDDRILWVTTSWDDGYPLDCRLGELLDRYGVEGTFYIPVRSQMPVMNPSEIRELSRRFDIGGHTLTHVPLNRLTTEQGRHEIFGAKHYIEDLTGTPCTMFCPPSGRYRREHLGQIREAGFLGVRTVELMSVAYPSLHHGLVLLPATLQLYRHRASTYVKNALKRKRWRNLQTLVWRARSLDLVQASGALLDSLLETGGVFHLWGHSWELEHSRLWGTLECVLKRLRANRDRCRFVSNATLCQHFSSGREHY